MCLPNRDTPGVVQSLAAAGKHILMEKPGGASLADVAPAIEAVRAAGVSFQNGYLWRYDAGAERIRSMIAERRFGKLISIEIGQFTADVTRRGKDHYLFDAETQRSRLLQLARLPLARHPAVSHRRPCHSCHGPCRVLRIDGGAN